MKTFIIITVIGLLAWIGFVLSGDIYRDTVMYVSPAICGIFAILMYLALIISGRGYWSDIQIGIGKACLIAFATAVILSFFSFSILDEHLAYNLPREESLDFRWLSATFSGFVGLSVFVAFYWFMALLIKKEKKAIDQGKLARVNYLHEKQDTRDFWLLISGGVLIVSSIAVLIFQESDSWVLVCSLITLGFSLTSLMVLGGSSNQLEKEVANAAHEFQKSEIAAEQERQRSENLQNKKLISLAADYLEKDPETNHNDWRSIIPDGDASHMKMGAKIALRRFLDQRKFEQARSLLSYYDADEFNLLPVMEALNHQAQTGALELSPRTFKLTLEKNETAYEKLPCNWQKIHTYLAPLEDEIDQADILDTGNIYITDQRVFFVGEKGSETVYLKDIAYMDPKEDALQFFRDEGLSEIFAFPTPHHARYAELVIRELMKP